MQRRQKFHGFSLIELLIVVSIMGILAALAMPRLESGLHDQLQAIAQVIASDLAYGRSLAVANGSHYRFTFETSVNQYVLRHSGANAALNQLPESPFHSHHGSSDEHVVRIQDLPHLGGYDIRVVAVTGADQTPLAAAEIEFGPFGETTGSDESIVWLAAGQGSETRYLPLRVDPVTGLAVIGQFTSVGPSGSNPN